MKFGSVLAVLSALKKLDLATAAPNAFVSPLDDFSIHAGQSMEINWIELSGATVNLRLLHGDPNNLTPVAVIAENTPNQGTLYWKVPDTVAPGPYTMEIVSDNGIFNYSPFFQVTDPVSMIGQTRNVKTDHKRKFFFF